MGIGIGIGIGIDIGIGIGKGIGIGIGIGIGSALTLRAKAFRAGGSTTKGTQTAYCSIYNHMLEIHLFGLLINKTTIW